MNRTGTVLLNVLLAYLLAACSSPLTVEQQIIAVIRDMEARIEAGERRPFMEHVAEGFYGQEGTMNRDQLNAFVLFQLHRHERVHVQLLPVHVTPGKPGEAEARFNALLTGGKGLLPDSGQVYEFVTRWQRQDDEWMLVSAHWQAAAIGVGLDH